LEKKLSTKLIISTIQNYDEILFSKSKEKYIYSRIAAELKSRKKDLLKETHFIKDYLIKIIQFFVNIF